VGRPGTGKSVLIRLAYAWNCLGGCTRPAGPATRAPETR